MTAAARSSVAETEGLICAFRLAPLAPCEDEVLKQGVAEAPFWVHLNVSNARARLWIERTAALAPEARATLLGADTRIHVEVSPEGVLAVLGDLPHDFHADQEGSGVLRLYFDQTRMISARRHPLKSIDLLRRELQAQGADIESPIALFERLIECLGQTFGATVAKLGDAIDDAEERILAGHAKAEGKALGRMRRSLARLRRQISANRSALAPLPGRLPGAYSQEQRLALRQAIERLDSVGQDLELVQERARLLQEEIAGRLTEATNRNLFLLSIVTTTLLPITLITGIFGMNVGGLPWLESARGFWWVILVMVLAVLITLFMLRRNRVL